MIANIIQTMCENNGYVSFEKSYSGRGMYGSRCIGITGSRDDCQSVIASVITELAYGDGDNHRPLPRDQFDQYVQELMSYSTDSMGRGYTIFYWPYWSFMEHEQA